MFPKVSIIILNWNGKNDTLECLDSLRHLTYPNHEIIIVDNGSTDDSVEFFKNASWERVKIIENKENLGFAEGNNIGIRRALESSSDYILLLNNDTIVDPTFLEKLIEVGESDNDIGILSPIIYYYREREKIQYSGEKINLYTGKISGIHPNNKKVIHSDTICGASMLIKKETIKKIGCLPTEYFMLWEDIDYSLKAKRNNIKNVYVVNSKIWHKGSVSIGNISSPFRIKYSMRNRIIFWKKYANKSQLICFYMKLVVIQIPISFLVGYIKTNKKKRFCSCFLEGLIEGIQY